MRARGFTLLELVMVIMIVALLAAISVPLFMDNKVNAQSAAFGHLAAAIQTSAQANAAARLAGGPYVPINQTNVCTTAVLSTLLPQAAMPTNLGGTVGVTTVPGQIDCSTPTSTPGDVAGCVLRLAPGSTPGGPIVMKIPCAR